MKTAFFTTIATIALAITANAQLDGGQLCMPHDCGDLDPSTNGQICCEALDPTAENEPGVDACGEVFVTDDVFVGGCVGPAVEPAGEEIGPIWANGCFQIGDLVDAYDILADGWDGDCTAHAAFACHQCGCAVVTGCPGS